MSRRSRAGFTLIELMVVVVIIGILAAIAIPALIGYTMRARTTEAFTMIADIRARQDSYRAEYGRYCGDVSATGLSWNPANYAAAGTLNTFDTADREWAQLGAQPDGPTRFRYRVFAGSPAESSGVPGLGGDFWYYAQAQADVDGDGTTMAIEAYSGQRQVYVSTGVAGPPLTTGYE